MWKLPERTNWAVSQNKHEPTRSYGEEIYKIVRNLPYEKALEIGATWGVSTMAILMAGEYTGEGSLLSVDPIPKYHSDMHATEETKVNGYSDRWSYWEGRSVDFWPRNKTVYDLIYIDGSHLYDDFRTDIFEAWKVLRDGGLLICDDITHKANKTGEYGISIAAWEFIKEHKIEHIHTTTRLLYIYKDENF